MSHFPHRCSPISGCLRTLAVGGLTHCFLVTFQSEADRDAYLPHPEHKAFVEVLKPHLEKVTVVDYWAKR